MFAYTSLVHGGARVFAAIFLVFRVCLEGVFVGFSGRFLSRDEELFYGGVVFDYVNNPESLVSYVEAVEAHNVLFEANVRGAYKIAHGFVKRFGGSFYLLEDALQDACVALASYIWRYDPSRGTKVLTGATWFIRKQLQVCVNASRPLPMSVFSGEKLAKVCKFSAEFDRLVSPSVSRVDFIAERTGFKPGDVAGFLSIASGVYSTDFVVGESGACVADLLVDAGGLSGFGRVEDRDLLGRLLSCLDYGERLLVCYRFGLVGAGLSESEFCERFGVDGSGFSRVMGKLRRHAKGLAGAGFGE